MAGIKSGDIIMSIDSSVVKNPSDIQEKINGYRPLDNIVITLLRNGDIKTVNVQLQGRNGVVTVDAGGAVEVLGAVLESVPSDLSKKLRIKGGAQIASLKRGKFKDSGVKAGLIITHINQVPVTTPQEVVSMINKARKSMLVEGVYPNGQVYYYGVGV